MDEEFNLFGGNMLSEEQFHKMMADEDTAMKQEASLHTNVPTEQQDMKDLGRNFQQMDQELRRDRNEGQNKTPEEVLKDQDTPQAPPPAPGNRTAQLRFLPRGSGAPSELPYTPSPPLVPEVTPKLPTPPPRGPFAPPPEGPAPETPFRRLPTPPRPRLQFDAGLQNSAPTQQDFQSDQYRNERTRAYDELRDKNDSSQPRPFQDIRRKTRVADEGQLPANAQPTAGQGEAYDKFKAEIEQARRDAAAPKEHSPVRDFFGEALNTAMAVGPGGAPRGSPFARSVPRTENTMSAPSVGASPEMIKSPALKLRGEVFEGANHGEAFVNAGEPNDMRGFQDGFTTTHGRFVSRQEAMEIAQRNDQTNRQPSPDSRNPEDYRLQSEDLIPRTRGEGAATYTPRDEGQMSPNARVQRGFGDVGLGGDGGPTPPTRPQGRPTNGRSAAIDAAEEANPRQPADQGEKRQGFRQYGTNQGEAGPKDSALRSVRRTEGVPPEEAQTKNLEAFPKNYFDRVPRERRQMGAGLSHPGFRWQIMENGSPIGTPQMNKMKANARADKMTSTYNTRYTVAPRPAGESELTPSERSYLQKYEINISRNTQ